MSWFYNDHVPVIFGIGPVGGDRSMWAPLGALGQAREAASLKGSAVLMHFEGVGKVRLGWA